MATRFYLPATGKASVEVGGWIDAWDEGTNTIIRRTSHRVKTGTAMATTTTTKANSATYALVRQYISDPLKAQTLPAGTFKGQIRVKESNADDNLNHVVISVWATNSAGDAFTANIIPLGSYGPTNEWNATTLTNRKIADGDATTSIVIPAGYRLVIEIGMTNATGTSVSGDMRFGDVGGDLSEDETSAVDNAPWVEFSFDIDFVGDLAATATGTASMTRAITRVQALTATATGTPATTRSITHALTATATGTPETTRSITHSITATATGSPGVSIRQTAKQFTVSAVSTPSLAMVVSRFRTLSATATAAPTLVLPGTHFKSLAASVHSISSIGDVVLTKVVSRIRSLVATATATPSIAKITSRTRTLTAAATANNNSVDETLAPSITTAFTKLRTLSATASGTATITRTPIRVKTLTASATAAPNTGTQITRVVNRVRTLAPTATCTATMTLLVAQSRVIPGTATGTSRLTREIRVKLTRSRTSVLLPTGTISGAQPFTPTGGSNSANVSDGSDSTFNSGSVIGDSDQFTLADLPVDVTAVVQVDLLLRLKVTAVTPGQITPWWQLSTGEIVTGDPITVTTSLGVWAEYRVEDIACPDGGIWTVAKVNGVKPGYQIVGSQGGSVISVAEFDVPVLTGNPATEAHAFGTANLLALKLSGRTLSATATGTPSVVRRVAQSRVLAVTATCAPTMARIVSRKRTLIAAATSNNFSVDETIAPSLIHAAIRPRVLIAIATASVSILRGRVRTLAATASGIASLSTNVTRARALAVTVTGAPIVTPVFHHPFIDQALTATALGTPTLVRVLAFRPTLSVTASCSPSMSRRVSRGLSLSVIASCAPTMDIRANGAVTLSANAAANPILTLRTDRMRSLTASAVGSPTLGRVLARLRSLVAAASGATVVQRFTARARVLAATATGSASIQTTSTHARTLTATATGSPSLLLTVIRSGAITLGATATAVPALGRAFTARRALAATAAGSPFLGRLAARSRALTALAGLAPSITRGVYVPLAASATLVPSLSEATAGRATSLVAVAVGLPALSRLGYHGRVLAATASLLATLGRGRFVSMTAFATVEAKLRHRRPMNIPVRGQIGPSAMRRLGRNKVGG